MTSNPNNDTLLHIKNWLRKQETDEVLQSKSKDRVHGEMAKQIRQIKPLPIGACNLCGTYSERLVPLQLKVCADCLGKTIKKGGELQYKREIGPSNCDLCLKAGVIMFKINPIVCVKCTAKQGKKHKQGIAGYQKKKEEKMFKTMEAHPIPVMKKPAHGRRVA